MIDTRFTDLEYPLVEFNVDDRFTEKRLGELVKNCLKELENLNIFNIAFDVKTGESLEKYIGSLPTGLTEKVNGLLRFNLNLLKRFNTLSLDLVKGYSDVIVNIEQAQLTEYEKMEELKNCGIAPILRITYTSTWEGTQQLYKTLDYLEDFSIIKYIIVNPDYRTEFDFKAFIDLQQLNVRSKRRIRAFFDRGSLPASILRAHPCNAYILSCSNCHYGKKDIPRSFVIDCDGSIYPEGLNERFANFLVGNIYEESLPQVLSDYWLGANHQVFKDACERVYHNYVLDIPFGLVPWRHLFYKEAQEILAEVGISG